MAETPEQFHLRRLADAYVSARDGHQDWTEDQAETIALALQFMALGVTDIEGWRRAVAAARAEWAASPGC